MPEIRPVSDLRNKFADISRIVHETSEPIYLTKNGYGDMVVMSTATFEKLKFDNEIYFKLKEAEIESESIDRRYISHEIFDDLRNQLKKKVDTQDV